ncbi:hypothetical protein ACFYSH_01420 [Streptomyces sp. NPDC005791]|uniref:wHTH domain-containing protein n=1 Tax=unclassified Streptomyces TaxID=2593676 RepID=UPI0033DAB97A
MSHTSDGFDPDAQLLASAHLDRRAPWLDPTGPVPPYHLLQAAFTTGRSPAEARDRFAELGYQVPTPEELAALPADAEKLVSFNLDGVFPWVRPYFASRMRGFILWAAAELKRSPAELAAEYVALGLPVRDPGRFPASVYEDDLILVSERMTGEWPWYEETDPATMRGRILRAAERLEAPPAEVAARYARLGYRTPGLENAPERIGHRELRLAADRVDGNAPWLADDAPVPLSRILLIVDRTGDKDDTKDPERTAAAAGLACRDLAALGYRVEPGVAGLTTDDLLLVSREMNGAPPWLDETQPVPVAHVLRLAEKQDGNPNALVMRLTALGYREVPQGSLADRVTAEELALAGARRTERGNDTTQRWLEQDDPQWLPHVLKVSVRTGKPPAEVMTRLRALGYRIPEVTPPSTVSDEDVRLVSRSLDGEAAWLDPLAPVSIPHVLRAAHARGTSPRDVLTRLAELGLTRLPTVPDRTVTEDDLRLVSVDGRASGNWLGDTVPYGRVLFEAATTGHGVQEAVDRYRELGYTGLALPDTPLPDAVSEEDLLLFRLGKHTWQPDWPGVDGEIPLPHILLRASAEAVPPAEIGRRLRSLGFRGLPAALPDTPFPGDPVVVSAARRPAEPWLDPHSTVSTDHVWATARTLDINPYDVANRLLALGYTLPFALRPEDRLLFSLNADGGAPWSSSAGIGHLLLAAKTLGRTPAEIATRRAELGCAWHDLPETAGFDDEDVLVLSENLDSRAPWFAWDSTPSLLHVLRAARATGRSPQETAARLARLGHGVTLPGPVGSEDIPLLEAMGRARHAPGVEHVLTMASGTGRSPAEVAASLRALGYDVPDAAYPTRRPAPTAPGRP